MVGKDLERPNGITLSPDEKTLYVANSHGPRPIWMSYELKKNGLAKKGKVFFDSSEYRKKYPSRKGGNDGMKVDRDGNIWATGPGGVLVFSPEGNTWVLFLPDNALRIVHSGMTAQPYTLLQICI